MPRVPACAVCRAPLAFQAYRAQDLASAKTGTPDGTRTHTGSILSRLPLPIGLRGRAQNVSQCAGLHRSDSRRVYLPCPPQQITSDYRSHMAKPQTVDEYLQSHTGPARDLLTQLREGSISLPYGSAFPRELLEKMVKFRVREFEDHGEKWM